MPYKIVGESPAAGDIVKISTGSASLTVAKVDRAYSSDIFGVALESDGSAMNVATDGWIEVNVTDENGSIKTGDYITSSVIAGFGAKAGRAGMALGVALSDFTPSSTSATVMLPVSFAALNSSVSTDSAMATDSAQIDRIKQVLTEYSIQPKVANTGKVRVHIRPGVVLPPTLCSLTDFVCRSDYFAALAPDSSGQTLSGLVFDGYIDRAFINELVVNSLKVGKVTLTDNSGSGVVPAGQAQTVIAAKGITENSMIQVTFESDYAPATRYFIKDKVAGTGFTVVLDQAVATDAKFTWWIVSRELTPAPEASASATPAPTGWQPISPTPELTVTPTPAGEIEFVPVSAAAPTPKVQMAPVTNDWIEPVPTETPVPTPAASGGFGTFLQPTPTPVVIDMNPTGQSVSGVISPIGN
jgi:hypothetical protein